MKQPDISSAPGDFIGITPRQMHYICRGKGDKTILALHKVTGGAEAWLQPLHELTHHFQVIAPDLRGHGFSHKPNSGYTLDDYSDDLAHLIDELKLDRLILMGHSLGARVALQLANRMPHSIESIICVEPPLSGPNKPPYPYDVQSALDWRQGVVNEGVAYCLKSNSKYSLEEAEMRTKYGILAAPQAIKETWDSFAGESLDGLLETLQHPTLLLYGDKGVISEEQASDAKRSPLLSIVKIANTGHNLPWENNRAFNDVVRKFLAAS